MKKLMRFCSEKFKFCNVKQKITKPMHTHTRIGEPSDNVLILGGEYFIM